MKSLRVQAGVYRVSPLVCDAASTLRVLRLVHGLEGERADGTRVEIQAELTRLREKVLSMSQNPMHVGLTLQVHGADGVRHEHLDGAPFEGDCEMNCVVVILPLNAHSRVVVSVGETVIQMQNSEGLVVGSPSNIAIDVSPSLDRKNAVVVAVFTMTRTLADVRRPRPRDEKISETLRVAEEHAPVSHFALDLGMLLGFVLVALSVRYWLSGMDS